MSWDPTQYLAFADHRQRPALELLARIPLESPRRVVDLGCGTGSATRAMRQRWPNAELVGIDGSPDMLERARADLPDASWIEADIGTWAPDAPVDVLYSNAALHWLDGHAELFPRLAGYLAEGGCLAIQMPANFTAPSHQLMYDVALDGPWRPTLEPLIVDPPTAPMATYYDILAPVTAEIDIWTVEYLQALTGDNPVAEFTKGTWLRRFLDALDEPLRSDFEDAYRARILEAYPRRDDGVTLFPFRRLFIVAIR